MPLLVKDRPAPEPEPEAPPVSKPEPEIVDLEDIVRRGG